MLRKVLWILMLIFLVQMQETEQKALHRWHKNGKRSQGHMFSKHSRPFLRRKTAPIVVEPQAEELYAFNRPFGFVDKTNQPEAKTAVNAEEIYAEDFRIKHPLIIKDITLKNDSSLTSALENELSIRTLMEELIVKSQLLSAVAGKEAVSNAIKEERLEQLHSAEDTSGKVVLKQETKQKMSSASEEFENQTISNNAENQDVVNGNKTGSETLNREHVQATANPAPATDSNEKTLLEEKFKKAIMQHYWQHILEEAKDMDKEKLTKEEEVSLNLKNELEKTVSKNATAFTVGIIASAYNLTLVEDSTKGGTKEKFQAELTKDKNNETLIEAVISSKNPVENQNITEAINAKEYQVEESGSLTPTEKLKQTLTKAVAADMKNNLTETIKTLQNTEILKAQKNGPPANISITIKDLTASQENNIDADEFLTAIIDDDLIDNNDINQIYDIQDRSNAIVRILHKDDLQTTKVFEDPNNSAPFNLTSVLSEPHPEDIVAMHLDDDTLKNQLNFLQNNAPKIKKHKEVLSDKKGLLEAGVLTKNDTELEADFEKAVQEHIHKIGQNNKTAIDLSKVLVNTSSVDSVEVLPIQQTDFNNEDVTLELPQYLHVYGHESDLPENIQGSPILQQPLVLTEHIQASVLKPVVDVAHIEHTTGANWSTIKVSTESVTTPPISLHFTQTPLISWMTEKSVEATTMFSKQDLNVKQLSSAITIGDETSNKVAASIENLIKILDKEADETIQQTLLTKNQTKIATSIDKWEDGSKVEEITEIATVAHIEHTTAAHWPTNKVSTESVTTPINSLKTPTPLTSWMTEKSVETTAMFSKKDLSVKKPSTAIALGDETSNKVTASIENLIKILEKKADETTKPTLLIKNQTQIATSTDKWEDGSKVEESTEIATNTQSAILDKVEETTANISVEKDTPLLKNTTELFTQEDSLRAENKTNDPKPESSDEIKTIVPEYDTANVDNVTSEATTVKTNTELNLLENFKVVENSKVFDENTTLKADILKKKDVDESIVYQNANEILKEDHLETPIKILSHETTSKSPILKAEELPKIKFKDGVNVTKTPEVLEASKLGVKETFIISEEYLKKPIATHANKVESNTATFATEEGNDDQLEITDLLTTTEKIQLHELRDESLSDAEFSKLKLDTTTSTTEILANGNLQFNMAESEVLQREEIDKKTGENAEKVIEQEEIMLEKETENDYTKVVQPTKAQKVKAEETHKLHEELKANLSVMFEELVPEKPATVQVETMTKEPTATVEEKIGLVVETKQNGSYVLLDDSKELVNKIEKNETATTKVQTLEEAAQKEENNDEQEENQAEKSLTEENVQVNREEAEAQDNDKIKKVSSVSDKLTETEELITVSNHKIEENNSDVITPLANDKLENLKKDKTTAEDNDKLGETNSEESVVIDNDDNDEENKEEIAESSAENSADEREKEMNETSTLSNDKNEEETAEEISAEDNEDREEESTQLSAVDNDEDIKANTEESIELSDANVGDEMIQKTTTENNVIIKETLAEENDLEDEEIMEDTSVNEENHVDKELLKETTAKVESQVKDEIKVENNDRKKEEITVEFLTAESDKVKEEDSIKSTSEDNEKIIKEMPAKDENQVKEVGKISAVANNILKKENTIELITANNNKDKVNDNTSEEKVVTDFVKVNPDKNEDLKYRIRAAIKSSNKIVTALDIVQVMDKIIKEIYAEDNNGVKNETSGESLTINNDVDKGEIKEHIWVETTDNYGTKDESNKEVLHKVSNDNAKVEQTNVAAVELADEVVESKIKEDMTEEMSTENNDEIEKNLTEESIVGNNDENINEKKDTVSEATSSIDVVKMKAEKIEDSTAAHRNKVIKEGTQEISSENKTKVETKEIPEQNNTKEKFSISSSTIENNKERIDNIEQSEVDHDKSKEIAAEVLKSGNKIQNQTAMNYSEIKKEIMKETATEEENVKVRVEDNDKKILNAVNTKESIATATEELKAERTVPTKSAGSDRTEAALSAISENKTKANGTEHDWKVKGGIVKLTVEQHKVKEAVDNNETINEKTVIDSLRKPNTTRRRKNPKRPVIKNSTLKSQVDKTKSSTSVKYKDPMVKIVTPAVEENTKVQEENRPTKVNVVNFLNKAINKKLLENLESTENNDKVNAEHIEMNEKKNVNENIDSDKNADAQQIIEHILLEKVEEFPKKTKTKLPRGEFEESVKIDKAVLKQIELNIARKQNATDTKENTADGNNKLRVIVSSKENSSTTTKPDTNTKTNSPIKNQTENGHFIETKENNNELTDESLSKAKTNKTSDNKNTEKKNQLQINDNNSIEIQKLNEDVSSTVNCVTTKAEAEVAATAATTNSKDIDDTDKNNQENSKRYDDIKTRAIKRIGNVLTEQQVEDENNKSIEKELNVENNKNAAAALDEVDHTDAVDVNEFADDDNDEMTKLKPVSLTWQQDNSSIAQSKEYEEDEEVEQQALESDEVDSYVDDDSAAENDAEIENQQIENTEDDKYADKSEEFKNNANGEEQSKHDSAADSKTDDKIKQRAETFEANNVNAVTERIIGDNTLQIIKSHGNRKISPRYETTAMPIEINTAAVNDDYDDTNGVVDVENDDDVAAVGFADTTQYHANKQIENIAALEEPEQQQQPISNWWSTLHHAEIRKFLNSIFNNAADEFYQEIARQARVELQEIPQRHSVVNDNRRKGSATHWLNNVWSLW